MLFLKWNSPSCGCTCFPGRVNRADAWWSLSAPDIHLILKYLLAFDTLYCRVWDKVCPVLWHFFTELCQLPMWRDIKPATVQIQAEDNMQQWCATKHTRKYPFNDSNNCMCLLKAMCSLVFKHLWSLLRKQVLYFRVGWTFIFRVFMNAVVMFE